MTHDTPSVAEEASLRLSEVVILVIADRCWGKGKTIREALQKCRQASGRTPRNYIAYLAHKDSYVDEMGYARFPSSTLLPQEIHCVGIRKRKEKS